MFRYVALVWTPGTSAQAEAASLGTRVFRAKSQWTDAFSMPGLRVFWTEANSRSGRRYDLAEQTGVILGLLFGRPAGSVGECSEVSTVLSRSQSTRIVSSEGRDLVHAYWGRYVAFLCDKRSAKILIVKSPRGGVPCFETTWNGVRIYFSSIQDCIDIGIRSFSINWPHLRARVAVGAFRSSGTALREVTEVHAGERISIQGNERTARYLWRPAEIASDPIEDVDLAAAQLRSTAKACVHAWASRHASLIHRLSGGLDSSIVLGCLQDTPSLPQITCLSYFHEMMRHSDERKYARIAAEAAGVEIVEHRREATAIDFRDLLRLSLTPNPAPHLAHLESSLPERTLSHQKQATAIFSGDAGDPLFYRHGKDLALADLLWRRGPSAEVVSLAVNVAPLIYRSVWSLLASAVRNAYFARSLPAPTGIVCPRHLVTTAAREEVLREDRFLHPWFEPDPAIPPGKQLHIRLALFAEEIFYAPLSLPSDPEEIHPLCSQPLLELCLRIPTYVHMDGGKDRGLARRAFAKDVPAEVISRTWKGRPGSLAKAVVTRNAAVVRELLLDGELVKHGVLDRQQVEEALSTGPTRNASPMSELFDHAITEAWCRTWLALDQRTDNSLVRAAV